MAWKDRKRYFKRVSHRKVRRSKLIFGKGNRSNKIFDYKWEIW